MKRIRRFYRQNAWVCYIGIISLVVIILRIDTTDVPELFNYGEEIFSLMYDLSLAVIGSVIFYYIVEFYNRDKIQEKYEFFLCEYLEYINYSIKEMIYILDDNPSNDSGEEREDVKDVVNRIFYDENHNEREVPCIVRTSDGFSSKRLDGIFKEQKNINDNVAIIINNFARFMSDSDMDLLTRVKINSIGKTIWKNKKYNCNHMVKIKEANEHLAIQKEIEKRIKEIKAS